MSNLLIPRRAYLLMWLNIQIDLLSFLLKLKILFRYEPVLDINRQWRMRSKRNEKEDETNSQDGNIHVFHINISASKISFVYLKNFSLGLFL